MLSCARSCCATSSSNSRTPSTSACRQLPHAALAAAPSTCSTRHAPAVAAAASAATRDGGASRLDDSEWGELTPSSGGSGSSSSSRRPTPGRGASGRRSAAPGPGAVPGEGGWYTGASSSKDRPRATEPVGSRQDAAALPGDWRCPECSELNFARRTSCRRCDAPQPRRPHSASSRSFAAQPGDWSCPDCGELNFARRTSCRSCDAPRPAASSSASSRAASSKPKVKKAASLAPRSEACCYGCGAPLQTRVPAAAGFVEAQRFDMKRRHKQLHQVLCARCAGLCNGAMIPAVEDFTQKALRAEQQQLLGQEQQRPAGTAAGMHVAAAPAQRRQQQAQQQQVQQVQQAQQPLGQAQQAQQPLGQAQQAQQVQQPGQQPAQLPGQAQLEQQEQLQLLGKVLITPEQLRDKIAEVRGVKALVVLLVDLLDMSGTLMGKVRDMVGNNPIVLVGTKLDLLPEGASPREVAEWLGDAAARRRLQVVSTHLVSSRSGEGMGPLAAKIGRERRGRDVFVVGAANVGKSAFVRALLREMSSLTGGNFDAAAAATSRYLPVESAMPGTTLGVIPLQAFESGGTLYDTPGVHLHHRVPHMLAPAELKLLHPWRRLAPHVPASPLELTLAAQEEEEEDGGVQGTQPKPKSVSATYLWSSLVRIDVLSAPPSTRLAFYGPPSLRVWGLPLLQPGQEVEWDGLQGDDEAAGGGDGDAGVLLARGSVAARGGLVPHELRLRAPAMPTASRGGLLADVAVSGVPGWAAVAAPYARADVLLRVWAPRGVEVFLRPPLPLEPPPAPRDDEAGDAAGAGGDLAELGAALDGAEADAEWAAQRAALGLRPMSAEDEEAVRLLLFGSEEAGLRGIVDEADVGDEAEEGGEDAAGAAQQPEPALRAEQLAARAADALSGAGLARRGERGGDADEAPAGAGPDSGAGTRRRRRQG